MMLAQFDARPGDRVLEIGAGTGGNAALLAELAGQTGEMTTLDIVSTPGTALDTVCPVLEVVREERRGQARPA